jgi:hypothetical protein
MSAIYEMRGRPGCSLSLPAWTVRGARAFSSEVETGSREENATKQKLRAFPALIPSKRERL